MKTLITWALNKILSVLSSSNIDELMVVIKFVTEASTKFSSSADKRGWVISQLKELWASKDESTIRYLLETAIKYKNYLNINK